ncbi:MAG: hypothetical protein SH850_10535 [Planctomycetaceae bacterium]|nr:hypothetical protein [Planctomycetaceae bacterium]
MFQPLSSTSDPEHLILTAGGDILGSDTPRNRELARRIKACLNACDGISTDELERGVVADMCRVLMQVVPMLEQKVAAKAAERAA